jgi:hypothetical protein
MQGGMEQHPGNVWKEYTAPDGRKYYHNAAANTTQWARPAEMEMALVDELMRIVGLQASDTSWARDILRENGWQLQASVAAYRSMQHSWDSVGPATHAVSLSPAASEHVRGSAGVGGHRRDGSRSTGGRVTPNDVASFPQWSTVRNSSNRDGGAKDENTGHVAGGSGKGKEPAPEEGGNRAKRKEGRDECMDAATKRKAVGAIVGEGSSSRAAVASVGIGSTSRPPVPASSSLAMRERRRFWSWV